jgi:molybdopterin synthase catalytic subunit
MEVFNKKVGMTSTSTKRASHFLPTAGWAVDCLKNSTTLWKAKIINSDQEWITGDSQKRRRP